MPSWCDPNLDMNGEKYRSENGCQYTGTFCFIHTQLLDKRNDAISADNEEISNKFFPGASGYDRTNERGSRGEQQDTKGKYRKLFYSYLWGHIPNCIDSVSENIVCNN